MFRLNSVIRSFGVRQFKRSNMFSARKEIAQKHLFDLSDLNVYNKDMFNLGIGAPGLEELKKCCKIFEKATKHCLEKELNNDAFLFQYGPTIGTPDFRENVAKFLSNGYQTEVNYSDLVLTAGATNGMHLILSTLLDLNGYIFVDDVTYMIALEAFHQFSNLKIIPVPLNESGTDCEALERTVAEHQFKSKDKMFWGMYYTIPTYHNPCGIVFSDDVNRNLINIARKYDILVACDDVYNLLYYDDPKPPQRLFQYDNFQDDNFKGHVISNGSFSKLLSPGIRIGWMECPPRIVELFRYSGILKSGGAINNYTGGILTSLIELGLAESQLKMYVNKYKAGRDALCKELLNLPKECSFTKPSGGYFVWIEFPANIDCADFNDFCLKNYKIFGIPGVRFSVKKEFNNFLRLSFSFHDASILQEAGRRFCVAANEYLQKQKET